MYLLVSKVPKHIFKSIQKQNLNQDIKIKLIKEKLIKFKKKYISSSINKNITNNIYK